MENIKETPTNSHYPTIFSGDMRIIFNILDDEIASQAFESLRDETLWNNMSHHGGHVPRLVNVQAEIANDGSTPVYRHPADQIPKPMPFSPTVKTIQEQVEKWLGHTVNHVLIQYYRDGTDYISEHSDKTLDIVPNTLIGNLSLGDERTMIFRSKRPLKPVGEIESLRQVVRVPLPHNSLCIVGPKTNRKWLHGIRKHNKLKKEEITRMAHHGARISLTFRLVGTFLSEDENLIWGQGATAKFKDSAQPIVREGNVESKTMLEAFRMENKDENFDWEKYYGTGFDLLHVC